MKAFIDPPLEIQSLKDWQEFLQEMRNLVKVEPAAIFYVNEAEKVIASKLKKV